MSQGACPFGHVAEDMPARPRAGGPPAAHGSNRSPSRRSSRAGRASRGELPPPVPSITSGASATGARALAPGGAPARARPGRRPCTAHRARARPRRAGHVSLSPAPLSASARGPGGHHRRLHERTALRRSAPGVSSLRTVLHVPAPTCVAPRSECHGRARSQAQSSPASPCRNSPRRTEPFIHRRRSHTSSRRTVASLVTRRARPCGGLLIGEAGSGILRSCGLVLARAWLAPPVSSRGW